MRLAAALAAAALVLSACAETQVLTPVSPLLGAPLSLLDRPMPAPAGVSVPALATA